MLKWLFRKQIARAEALEHYLSHFDAGELAYLKNITLIGLRRPPLPGMLSLNQQILLVAYIQAEWMAKVGKIEPSIAAKARVRSVYNVQLARDISKVKPTGGMGSIGAIMRHRLDEPDLTNAEEERLGSHAIVLARLFDNPRGAATLPELNDLQEGIDWLPFR